MTDKEPVEVIYDSLMSTANLLEYATNGESPLNDVHWMDAAKEALAALRKCGFELYRPDTHYIGEHVSEEVLERYPDLPVQQIDLPTEVGADDVLVAYNDRKLSWRERVNVYLLLRPDPRVRVVR